jgi:hypothetical protein
MEIIKTYLAVILIYWLGYMFAYIIADYHIRKYKTKKNPAVSAFFSWIVVIIYLVTLIIKDKNMKNFIIILLLSLSCVISAQKVITYIHHDKIEDIKYCFASPDLIIANAEQTKGFRIQSSISYPGLILEGFIVQHTSNLGDCNENNKIIIVFANEQKITLSSWSEFNCQATSYYKITPQQATMLSQYPISVIRFTNGRSYDSYTGTPTKGEEKYFIDMLNSLKLLK